LECNLEDVVLSHSFTVPGIRESIKKGRETPIEDCGRNFDW
jgi:hypothetical protein